MYSHKRTLENERQRQLQKEAARQIWIRKVLGWRGKNYVAPRSMTEAEKQYYAIHKNLTNFNRV